MVPRLGVEHRHPQSRIRMAGVGDGLPGRTKLGMNDVDQASGPRDTESRAVLAHRAEW